MQKTFLISEELQQAIVQYIAQSRSNFTFAEVSRLMGEIQKLEEIKDDGNTLEDN